LLRKVDARIGLMPRLAACFVDYRNPENIEHPGQRLLAQRIYALRRLGLQGSALADRAVPAIQRYRITRNPLKSGRHITSNR